MIRLLLILLAFAFFTETALAQERAGAAPPRVIEQPQEEKGARSPLLDRVEQQKETVLKNAPHMREILILADRLDQREITETLKEQGFEIVQTHSLRSLDSALIITKGDEGALQTLRNKFPQAEIDWNDDLSASAGPRLYAKDKIKWPDQGACLDGALKIPIGLIDGKIDRSHPAFAGQSILEKNFLDDETPDAVHATAIASILIGNAPDQGFDGLLTGAKLYSAVALRHSLDDKQLASIQASVRGLDWLLAQDVRLINVSLAGDKNRVLVRSFEAALAKGALIFAAAGNNGPGAPPAYPAAIEGVFAVTAIDAAGRPYKAANTGDYIDFVAPGVDIWAATPDGSGAYKSGTSYAVPYVLAATALQLTKNPELSRVLISKVFDQNINAECP